MSLFVAFTHYLYNTNKIREISTLIKKLVLVYLGSVGKYICIYLSVCVYLSMYVSVYVSIYLSIYLSFFLSIYPEGSFILKKSFIFIPNKKYFLQKKEINLGGCYLKQNKKISPAVLYILQLIKDFERFY